jgi:hypothetical protein
MSSFNVVNYSLRANKSIQRSLVFEGVRTLQSRMDLEKLMYVGLSSVWFTDFHIAHKALGVEDLVSIEADPIGFERARFNLPFRTARVEKGFSYDVLPIILKDQSLTTRPWFVWLDYDGGFEESTVEDIRLVIEQAPPNSIFVTTFNASGKKLGKPANRPERIRKLLGSVVPDGLSRDDCQDDRLPETLLELTSKFMESVAASVVRPGGFIPAFRIHYSDTTPMVTIGGILPEKGAVPAARAAVSSHEWPGIALEPIIIPPLTIKEAAALQTQLPRAGRLTRAAVRRLGFDLEEQHIRCFQKYYRYYPAYAQITA